MPRGTSFMAAMSGAWLRRKVHHPWVGGPHLKARRLQSDEHQEDGLVYLYHTVPDGRGLIRRARSDACGSFDWPPAAQSLPSPPNHVGFNPMVGPDAAPRAVNPKTGKRKHVGAIVIFTK
jgi:hypothetical protein